VNCRFCPVPQLFTQLFNLTVLGGLFEADGMLVPAPTSWLSFDYIGSILLSTNRKLALHKTNYFRHKTQFKDHNQTKSPTLK